ncbi:MAG: FAD-dependent oxidoreductase [Thermoplasmata archaeon]|nr:FAD-dependent oxidoreductase [Thermoplasmata archaeon]
MTITLKINDEEIKAGDGMTILEAAQSGEIYIPRLCYHPSLGSSHGLKPVDEIHREDGEFRNDGSGPEDGYSGCRLCLVEIEGRDGLFTSCDTLVEEGMVINTETDAVKEERRDNLAEILRDHPHACLLCAQQEGCSRTQCSTNVPEDERCCPLLGHCELQKVSQYVGVKENLTKYVFKNLPKHEDEALFTRDYNLCISCLRCVRACRDLRDIETLGFVYQNGKAIVGPTKNSNYAESDCRFCGACAEVCPTGAITDKDLPKGEKQDVLVPCISNCPAGIDIPSYIWHIGEGRYAEATSVIKEKLPFPLILGWVCFHPCEDACRRGELNQPMAICSLKRFAAENDGSWKVNPKGPTGKGVAVVGSGPAGLSAAYYMALSGHNVTVFEAEEKIGGMLRYAIPDYRLPSDVLDDELRVLADLNIEFKINTRIGVDVAISDLRQDFDAVFVGTGATNSRKITLEGSELDGVEWGLDFLKDVKKGKVTTMTGRVMVIGGGNVAMDVARTAMRLGASEVQLACLESDEEMPAHDWEIEEAREEGVIMNPSWGPKIITGDNKVTGIELVKCTSVFDKLGNFAPKFDDTTTTAKETDSVILAIGQSSDLSFLTDIDTKRGAISVNEEMQTNTAGVFAGGEAARGPSSVVEAVADGALAVSAIDKYLGGDGNIYESLTGSVEPEPGLGKLEGFADMDRADVPKRSPDERKSSFDAVELGYDENLARQEAVRCLRCDLRLDILPVTLPPDKWFELNEENVAEVPAIEGVFQLLDETKMIIVIKGSMDIQADLRAKLDSETKAKYFGFEPDPMYSKRESELIQQYLQQFGKMPEGDGEGDDLDDLF